MWTAGAKYEWIKRPVRVERFIAEDECDIVILGAGVAGCTAAESAAVAGASVICCEKFGSITGHGTDIGAVGTKVQAEHGVTIDKALAARLIHEWGQQQGNYWLIRTFTERSGSVLDYYIDMARENGLNVALNDEMTARADWDSLEDKYKQFQSAHIFDITEKARYKKRKWNASYFVEMVYDNACKAGAEFRFNESGHELITEMGAVTGVITRVSDGYKKIKARLGVIIATGGITDNKDMLERWCPAALRSDLSDNFPVGGNMGDGLVMGVLAGAAITRCNPAPIIHPVNLTALSPGMNTSWLTVNRDGMRFSSEVAWEPIITNARLNVPGNVAYAIWDSDYREHLKKQEPLKAQKILPLLSDSFEKELASGAYVKADSISELAEKLGISASALERTIQRYNSMCERGIDDDFGVPERFLSPVKKAPYYTAKISAWMLNVPHGLHVDHNSQVLTETDEPIAGLFAIGNAQGDFFANSYPVTLPGASHGHSITFGYLVGKALAAGTVINGYDSV